MRDYAAIAEQYARDVVSGEVPACRYVELACARHLADLDRQGADGFDYEFDEAKAAAVCGFVELLPHTKGRWAREGVRLVLEPWQVFITACVFGWVHAEGTPSAGLRRFRTAYVEVPRKNGKSAWSSALGLYMLAADGEHGAEVYSGATTEKQAKIVFEAARKMARETPDYREAFGVEVMTSNLHVPADGSKFEAVIGKPGDGASPSFAVVDEFHEHQTDDLYDTMETGMGAREQPLMWVITTAGSDTAGPCYALRRDVVRMLEGVPRGDLFGVVYTIDDDDDWTSDAALEKANPNLGVSVSAEFLRAQIRDAVQSARKQNVIKTKHLNVWTTAREGWMNMEAWNACADAPPVEEFAGEACWMGLDLASKVDVASAGKLFRREQDGEVHFYLYVRNYLPEARIEEPEKRHYQGWVVDGHLTATDGDIIDHRAIRDDITEDAEVHRIVTVGYDPYNATQLAVELTEAGIDTLEVRQTVAYLSDAMKWFEALVLAGRLHHTGCPALAWMVSNVTVKPDANDNVFPRKERAENKIDAAVAAIIALYVARRDAGPTTSIYETRGVITL